MAAQTPEGTHHRSHHQNKYKVRWLPSYGGIMVGVVGQLLYGVFLVLDVQNYPELIETMDEMHAWMNEHWTLL